jgi:predicted nucleic acid-binding protein
MKLPSGLLLLDTGIYIRYSRGDGYSWLLQGTQNIQRTVLTAVVAAELYAGTRDRTEKLALDELCRAHRAMGHFSTPTAETWLQAGSLLRRAHDRFGHLDFARHFRDALIAVEAVQAGATLITENVRDFNRWKALLAASNQTLKIFKATARE